MQILSPCRIYPGHGQKFVAKDAKVSFFINAKADSLFHQRPGGRARGFLDFASDLRNLKSRESQGISGTPKALKKTAGKFPSESHTLDTREMK